MWNGGARGGVRGSVERAGASGREKREDAFDEEGYRVHGKSIRDKEGETFHLVLS